MTLQGSFQPPRPFNEPGHGYTPGSAEQDSLKRRLAELAAEEIEIPLQIGGRSLATGVLRPIVMPHHFNHRLGQAHQGGTAEMEQAIQAAIAAMPEWSRTPWMERAAIFLRAAELLSGLWRDTLNAATMLGQSKTVQQSEIDAACELCDFLRFNVAYMTKIYAEQPESAGGAWNSMEYRALEGFVLAITPFN
ncbi:MAG: aldehyde dehydrogenase family protein, partial [Candidatus Dormibacteraceae bacterium]